VRELQRVTGSIIKLPEHTTVNAPSVDEETTVHIIGPFFSVQSAQRRIRTMIVVTNPPPASGRPKPSSSGQQTPQQVASAPSPTTVQPKPQNQSNAD
jgi:insulin-like growth factor 2 mRNA-binding protein 1